MAYGWAFNRWPVGTTGSVSVKLSVSFQAQASNRMLTKPQISYFGDDTAGFDTRKQNISGLVIWAGKPIPALQDQDTIPVFTYCCPSRMSQLVNDACRTALIRVWVRR